MRVVGVFILALGMPIRLTPSADLDQSIFRLGAGSSCPVQAPDEVAQFAVGDLGTNGELIKAANIKLE